MRFLHEWQKVVHKLNRDKGFYDYEHDLASVKNLLDETYRGAEMQGFGSEAPVTLSVDLSRYWALVRIVQDYEKAMLERKLLLVIGEVCEAHEELRAGHEPCEVYTNGDSPKPEGVGIEIADALIRALDVCESVGVDADASMEAKHQYNATREYRHGKAF